MYNVSIFDDDENILELCSFILEQKGYTIKTYENCNNIVEHLKQDKPDLIFMDNWIPEMGGIQATKLIKADAELRDIPVIYFSANNDIKLLAEKAGADKYLAKPFDITELEQIVESSILATRG